MIRYIYTFFVGLFLVIFIGMGIAVFYTAPKAPEPPMFYGKELTAEEQQQQKAFIYILPLFMGFLFYSLPSGLILYWTVFSLMSLLDWFLFKRNKLKNTEVQTV